MNYQLVQLFLRIMRTKEKNQVRNVNSTGSKSQTFRSNIFQLLQWVEMLVQSKTNLYWILQDPQFNNVIEQTLNLAIHANNIRFKKYICSQRGSAILLPNDIFPRRKEIEQWCK